jgi:hypothetical protein
MLNFIIVHIICHNMRFYAIGRKLIRFDSDVFKPHFSGALFCTIIWHKYGYVEIK